MTDFRMSTERRYAAGAYDPTLGFVITGGHDGLASGGALSSAERTFDGINFSTITSMPRPLCYHCLVSLKNGNLFATGGNSNAGTFMYHGSDNTWSTLNNLPANNYAGKTSLANHKTWYS